jgi:hypothetical protein
MKSQLLHGVSQKTSEFLARIRPKDKEESELDNLVLARTVRRALRRAASISPIGDERQFVLKAVAVCAKLERMRKDGFTLTASKNGERVRFRKIDAGEVDLYTFLLDPES